MKPLATGPGDAAVPHGFRGAWGLRGASESFTAQNMTATPVARVPLPHDGNSGGSKFVVIDVQRKPATK